ncbi:fibroblast growth factor-binding protein 2 [Brienomyrus brachyistius]|uniref:fibroblast growth factor-binding protein 2 n=1 Tax=Brienomyrus brachyistius TaxID=42636 RepID=UPI0020B24BA3|nr:fibroblast growth factor-binding protein 2 [Brienomyrus brachyistius]
MKLVCAVVFIICLHGLQGAEGRRDDGGVAPAGRKGKSKTVPTSGELVTKDMHTCTWEIDSEGEDTLLILISCNHDGEAYRCRYAGRPSLCREFGASPRRYWSQVVSRLRRKAHACRGEKVLRPRSCQTAPAESHMKLLAGHRGQGGAGRTGREGGRQKRKSAKEQTGPPEEQRDAFGEADDSNTVSNTETAENYCAEGWQTVCSFFVRFFDG